MHDDKQNRRGGGLKGAVTKGPIGRRAAGIKAAETKGPEERKRAANMAAWTKKHGKNDATNPYSKQNVS
jgi:hypothetical protein